MCYLVSWKAAQLPKSGGFDANAASEKLDFLQSFSGKGDKYTG